MIGPLSHGMASILYIVRVSAFVNMFSVATEASIIRLLIDRVWHRIPPISDEFFFRFFAILNPILGALLAIWTLKEEGAIKDIAR